MFCSRRLLFTCGVAVVVGLTWPDVKVASAQQAPEEPAEKADPESGTAGEGEGNTGGGLSLDDLGSDAFTVEEVEVQAPELSEAEKLRQSSAPVEVLDLDTAQKEAADMGDILNRTRAVTVQRAGGLGGRQSLCLHGLCDQQVRVFVDGVPLDFYGLGRGPATLPVDLVRRVEIYRGVIPLRLGADSLGGAIDFVTRENPQTGVSASYRLGSFGTHRFAAEGTYGGPERGWFVRARSFYDHARNDYEIQREVSDERGRPQDRQVERFHDRYLAHGVLVDAGALDRSWADELSLQLHYVDAHKELQNNTSGSRPFGDAHASNRTWGATLRYRLDEAVPDLDVDLTLAYARREADLVDQGTRIYDWTGSVRGERSQPGEIRPGNGGFLQTAFTDRVLARGNAAYALNAQHTLRFNLTSGYARRTGEDRTEDNRPVPGLESTSSLNTLVGAAGWKSTYLDSRLETLTFVKAYQLWSEGRRVIAGEDVGPVSQSQSEPGWGSRLVFWVTDHIGLKGSYERTLRFPQAGEVFGDGVLVLPNGELQAERSHNVNAELMLDWPQGRLGALHAEVAGIGRLTDQEIRLVIQDPFRRHENVAETRSLGAEASSQWTSPGRWASVGGSITYLDARSQAGAHDGSRIPNRPYLFASASLQGRFGSLLPSGMSLRAYWRYRYVHSFFRFWEDAGAAGTKDVVPAQHVSDVGVTYDALEGRLGVTLEVQNVTDARVFDVVGVERPGRAVFFQLRGRTRAM
jgi:outer membrane cobalamin receptor